MVATTQVYSNDVKMTNDIDRKQFLKESNQKEKQGAFGFGSFSPSHSLTQNAEFFSLCVH